MMRKNDPAPGRRDFLKKSTLGTSWIVVNPLTGEHASDEHPIAPKELPLPLPARALDLTPAQWVWYPSGRILQNTVVLFRRRLYLGQKPISATGWILGESRYRFFVNGERAQWGPAPSDPRWAEADPLDLTASLHEGMNILAAEVLYFGQGDGTWPIGKAGFIFKLDLTFGDGRTETIVSDSEWKTSIARSWRPGQYKRWYLRAFQEAFDARLYPHGWLEASYQAGPEWLSAMNLQGAADKPAICTSAKDYLLDSNGDPAVCQLRSRSVPMLKDTVIGGATLRESMRIRWVRPPEEYFESLTPDAFVVDRTSAAHEVAPGAWRVQTDPRHASAITFSFSEQVVGWPFFSITASEGTIVEMMVHEAHQVGGTALLNTRFHSWTRFICKEGQNDFESFDFESLRWMQLHIRNAQGPVTVESVGVRRRLYPWALEPAFRCSDEAIQRVWEASVNTLKNCAQDTIVDCMGRERQQYSGDIGHVIHALQFCFGERMQVARYIDTFGQGLTNAGYFLDCWPAYDRLARVPARELQLTRWGPLLDHGIGHIFDAYYYYLYSGDVSALTEAYPRLLRFFDFLRALRRPEGLLPVENIGIPVVWIDNDAYQLQRHKMCAFNLYASAMMQHALAPLCRAFGNESAASVVTRFGEELQQAVVSFFWSHERKAFVVNQPWLSEEVRPRYCDRSLATAIMFKMCPSDRIETSVRLLAEMPPEVGMSYPANAGWRLWGLASGGRGDVVVNELRERWGKMRSVAENNTLSESWEPGYDNRDQWSHAPVAPLYLLYMGILGLKPTTPGFETYEIRPQLGNLPDLDVTAQTPIGPVRMVVSGRQGNRTVKLHVPSVGRGTLVLKSSEAVHLEPLPPQGRSGLQHFALPQGRIIELSLRHT